MYIFICNRNGDKNNSIFNSGKKKKVALKFGI